MLSARLSQILSRKILLKRQTFATGFGLPPAGFHAPHGYEKQAQSIPGGHSLRGAGDVAA
jgi:hypothetical protein